MQCRKLQFGLRGLAALTVLALPGLCVAQNAHPHPDRPPQRQTQPHVNAPSAPGGNHGANPNNRPANGNPQAHPNANNGANRENGQRNGSGAGYVQTPRQQLGVGAARPWVDQMRDLSPSQRDRVLQNSKAFQNLSPDKQARIRQQFKQWDIMTPTQQADLRTKENTWRNLTPDQREHIKNDVLPKWRQMPWDRQQVMKQKLGVLQNMPESARNQRLNDPNFTRGMSDDEKSMLHDLSHTHVGAPELPNE